MDEKKNDKHMTSRMLTYAGGLMAISGILMALCGRLAIGGIMWAAASCMFFGAYHFRLRENKKNHMEETDDEQETL